MASFSELFSSLSPDPRLRGFQFEQLTKWYLENDPVYRLEFKKVWLWKDWLPAWGRDAGIDLVGETFDGQYWAIQTKAYSPEYAIKKSDVDTFLSESSREIFSYRLLVASTNLIGNTARRTLEHQQKPVGLRLLYDLEKALLSWPDSPEHLKGRPAEPKKPFSHQAEAISNVCEGFNECARGQLVMACGTGKTLVSLWVAERLQSRRTLVLAPSLSILAYTLREWTANASEPFRYLAVCSDETVQNRDEWTQGIVDLGLPVTTDSQDIANFLQRTENLVVFSTYQSSPSIAEALEKLETEGFDLAISDEAHRCAGPATGPFATILDSSAIRARYRLFMTGTPRYFSGQVKQIYGMKDYDIASMDDERKFGPVFHRLSFSEAISRDLLSDYQVAIVAVDDPTYRYYAERGRFVTTDSQNIADARTVATHIALAKAMKKWNLTKIVSFHSRVKAAQQFSRELPEYIAWMPEEDRPVGTLWADYVSGEMPSSKREAKLDRLRHLGQTEKGLLANARCLLEGVDLPELDAVAFVDPRASQVDIVQAVGRAIRKSDEKKVATIILPIFVDSVDDSEHFFEKSAFKPLWDVLRALRSHDDALAESLDQLRRERGEFRGRTSLPKKIILNFPATIDERFVDAFSVKLVEQSTASWDFWFGLLMRFVKQTGNALVRQDFETDEGYRLGLWVSNQRSRRGRLSSDQTRALEQLPSWTWKPREASWDDMFDSLLQFVDREGHATVKQGYVTEDGVKLGAWVSNQRTVRNRLSAERRQTLEKLPGWTWNTLESSWDNMFHLLKAFVNQHGHSRVPDGETTEGGVNLGNWVSHQRMVKEKLSNRRRQALEKLPDWTWNVRESYWDFGFQRLVQFVRGGGHSDVPTGYTDEMGFKLGLWIATQRQFYRRQKLSRERCQALEDLPGWTWNARKSDWDIRFGLLKAYVHRHGHSRVPLDDLTEDGVKLGYWVSNQRSRCTSLSKERKEALEKLPGWTWDANSSSWDYMLGLLRAFVNRNNHARVSYDFKTEDGAKLGIWLNNQRRSKERLSNEQRQALEALPGWTWSARDHLWNLHFDLLRRFVELNGHATVKQGYVTEDGVKLGAWVRNQRARRVSLSRERQKALEGLPGWTWNVRN